MDDASNDDPRVGTVLAERYRILERLAVGSMGVVYRAERVQLGRPLAVKFLHASYASDPQFIQRFERETRVMSRLTHPHCVSVIDFGVEDAPYVVMEYVDGSTLKALVESGRVEVDRAIYITRQVLAGLAHAHAQGIVHRDIKPANIMLTEATGTGDHVRILDFGLATLRDAHSADLSQTAIVVGTPNYMSPEQSMAGKVDARSDVYSTGVVLFELLTGHKPFTADDTFELLNKHRTAPVPRLQEVAPDAPFSPGLQHVVDRALAKQPEDRYPSAIEFAVALDAAVSSKSHAAAKLAAARPSEPAAGTDAPAPAATPTPAPPPPPSLALAPTQAMASQAAPRRSGPGLLAVVVFLGLVSVGAWAGYSAWTGRHSHAAPPPVGANPAAQPASGGALARVDRPGAAVIPGPPAAAAVMVFDAGVMRDGGPLAAAAGDGGAAAAAAGPTGDAGTAVAMAGTVPGATGAQTAGTADAGDDDPPDPPLPADERDEPVAQVPDNEDNVDSAEPKTPAAAVAKPTPAPPPNPADTIPEAVALIRAGKREQAIRALLMLKRKMPRSAYVPYLLGNLYFEKRWWTVGMDYYRAAIRNNHVYRRKRILNHNVIRALGDGRTRRTAVRLFLNVTKRASLPYLRHAAKHDPNPRVRGQASWLARRLGRSRHHIRRRNFRH